ncbi:hypothetical protein [Sphingomonas yantingensis]|uniref:DUF2924 domain-containing protein n=1 Tax=Sphingomonas yantingensis TaxID=1241761 RepID=A0A7W9ASY4_9SPHN|nr:hypothetical protein [Sphingomonas yantingensis]MBB5699999.1 hypothetical protein [Sphingomonas yantingensis]
MEHRTIEIDFDVHKRIEAERSSFAETPNEVLRRLLGITDEAVPKRISPVAEGRAWTGKGVTLPAGTQVRMRYNGRALSGIIVDGSWVVEGQRYSSPSSAASESCTTKSGARTSLDGWKYWEAKRPGDEQWRSISSMRPEPARLIEDAVASFR